jgi:NADH-quinone oxidoreductase subunit N
VMIEAMPGMLHEWRQIVIFVSVLSMFLGSVAAIGQSNIKRLMAYSSIAHMGYALVGIAAGTIQGVEGVLLYLLIYVITNAGVFVCILMMRRKGRMIENISDLSGLAQTNPRMALAFAVLFVSLAGIPPFAGFFAKFYIFVAAIDAHLYTLAVLMVLASVIGGYYYFRVGVKVIYFDEPAPAFDSGISVRLGAIAAGSSLFNLVFVLIASPLVTAAVVGAKALLP